MISPDSSLQGRKVGATIVSKSNARPVHSSLGNNLSSLLASLNVQGVNMHEMLNCGGESVSKTRKGRRSSLGTT